MKKMTMVASGVLAAGMIGTAAYIALHPKTRQKAQKAISNVMDDANSYLKNMQK